MDLPNASDHTLPCRPTISCTADFATPGTLELEAGGLASRAENQTQTTSFPFLLKLTLSKMFQAQIGSNGGTFVRGVARADFFDDLDLGVKLHLADQSRYAPSFAVTALVGVPSSSYSRASAFVTLHASKDFGPIHADANGGVAEIGIDVTPAAQPFASLALSTSVTSLVGVALETYYFGDAAPFASNDGGFRFVATLAAKPWLVFDAGGDVGYFPSVRAFSAFVGMTVVPAVLWRK